MSSRQLERRIFLALPSAVLGAGFIGICLLTGTPWPWTQVVHEDGTRTLLGTIFYWEHATRELVPDLILAMGVGGAVRCFFPPGGDSGRNSVVRVRRRFLILGGTALVVIVGGTLWEQGIRAIGENLSQLHTRAGVPLVPGAHWRYHLIERFAQLSLAFCVVGLVWIREGRPDPRPAPGRKRLLGLTLALFAGLTLLFRPTLEPFREPTFLGHQARELFTHVLVTLPLALGVCFGLVRRFAPRGGRSPESLAPIAWAGGVSLLAGLYLLVGTMVTGAQDHGQTSGLARLLIPHFAEHALGYVVVPALAGVFYLWPGAIWRRPPHQAESPDTV